MDGTAERSSADRSPTGRVDVLGVRVSAIGMPEALSAISGWIANGSRQYVCVDDVHAVMEGHRNPQVRQIHNASGLTTPDGVPLVWAGRLAGARRMRRVCGRDLMTEVSAVAAGEGWRCYLYGGKEGVAELAAAHLTERHPGLTIVGTDSPPFRLLTSEEDQEIVDRINRARPDVVWVGLGTPKQELWMAAHVGRVSAPVLIGVGGAFDMHAGLRRPAPAWMQRFGFEWLFRAALEPRRLAVQYVRNNSRFIFEVLRRRPRLIPGEVAAPPPR